MNLFDVYTHLLDNEKYDLRLEWLSGRCSLTISNPGRTYATTKHIRFTQPAVEHWPKERVKEILDEKLEWWS